MQFDRATGPAEGPSHAKKPPALAKRSTCRVDDFELATLEITDQPEGKKATVKPTSLSGPKPEGAVGCVLLEGQGHVYQLLWDGKSQAVAGRWQIGDSDGDTKELAEDTLDERLEILFDFSEKPAKLPKKQTCKFKFDDD